MTLACVVCKTPLSPARVRMFERAQETYGAAAPHTIEDVATCSAECRRQRIAFRYERSPAVPNDPPPPPDPESWDPTPEDRDPSNVVFRAGCLRGMASRTNCHPDDRATLIKASRSLMAYAEHLHEVERGNGRLVGAGPRD